MISLAGTWRLAFAQPRGCGGGQTDNTPAGGEIRIPGSLQEQGYGEAVRRDTAFVSSLYDPIWYEKEEFSYGQEDGVQIPFLSQPRNHFIGRAFYSREVELTEGAEYSLLIELTRQQSEVWVDGRFISKDFSLCAPHLHALGWLAAGTHLLTVAVDNSMFYAAYRPDAHTVTDNTGASFNGMVGEVALLTSAELAARRQARRDYAKAHPVSIRTENAEFVINGRKEFLRGNHFGGEVLKTGYPDVSRAWWERFYRRLKDWGINFVRFHSYCPPDMAFTVADELGMYLQVEAGMWNVFSEGAEICGVLEEETRRILENFGHHPSFVLFAPSNEPGGAWEQPLAAWVKFARACDAALGYEGRRVYSCQAGWPYSKPPRELTGLCDYLYFHNSGFGPNAGRVRGVFGWKGRDYRESIAGTKLPVIAHELGQWTSYPDFDVIKAYGDSFLTPGNYREIRANAAAHGMLARNRQFVYCSGRLQLMLYREDVEAQFRTPGIGGFELLDLHDYCGQGTACVGFLDATFRNKGIVTPEEWRRFCGPRVVLARFPGYVFKNTDRPVIPVELCDYADETRRGKNLPLEEVALDFSDVLNSEMRSFRYRYKEVETTYDYTVFAEKPMPAAQDVLYTRDFAEAEQALAAGRAVVYSPHLTELDYSCPPLSFTTVFWDSQMGPNWARGMGMVCDTSHPVFRDFPTEVYGGWQWEDIFDHARGLNLEEAGIGWEPVVRAIDDCNRNLSLGLIVEGRVGQGRLLLVTADLDGSFAERPAAYALKQALCAYAASERFAPEGEISLERLRAMFLPNNGRFFVEDGNPVNIKRYEGAALPLDLTIQTGKSTEVRGFVYLANQKDRERAGEPKELEVYADSVHLGTYALRATVCQQKFLFDVPVYADNFILRVTKTWQEPGMLRWKQREDGWHSYRAPLDGRVSFSVLGLITDEQPQPGDRAYWRVVPGAEKKDVFV